MENWTPKRWATSKQVLTHRNSLTSSEQKCLRIIDALFESDSNSLTFSGSHRAFIKIIGLICIIRIISTISQNLISPGRARRPLRPPGPFGVLPGRRKSVHGSPFTIWVSSPRSHVRIVRVISILYSWHCGSLLIIRVYNE